MIVDERRIESVYHEGCVCDRCTLRAFVDAFKECFEETEFTVKEVPVGINTRLFRVFIESVSNNIAAVNFDTKTFDATIQVLPQKFWNNTRTGWEKIGSSSRKDWVATKEVVFLQKEEISSQQLKQKVVRHIIQEAL